MKLREVIEDFCEDQRYKGNSPATLTLYRVSFEHFLKDTGLEELHDLTGSAVRSWLLSHSHLSRTTLATYDRALRVLSGWAWRRGYIRTDPLADLPKPKARRTEPETFTPEQVRAILTATQAGRNPKRNAALVVLLLDTGLRIGEAVSLTLHDINWQDGWLRVDGKTGPRSVPFGRKAKQRLRAYVEQERRAGSRSVTHIFLTDDGRRMPATAATKSLIRLARRAGVESAKLGPHTFRHTFAVEFIRNGGDAFTLQRLLGHTTLEMTRRYVHLADSDLASAHKRFGPADKLL